MNRTLCIGLLGLLYAGEDPDVADHVLDAVSGDTIRSHIAYLADDRLMGRLPGTPGYDMAVDYVTARYRQYGLEPAGDSGTYLQYVTIRKGYIDKTASEFVVDGKSKTLFKLGSDYVFFPDLNSSRSEITAPLVFVGYGIDRPGRNDYAGVDVRNKIAVMVTGAPDSLPATEFAHFSNFTTKFETAVRHGAAGIVLCTPGSSLKRSSLRYADRGNTGIVSPDGEAFGRTVFAPALKFVAIVDWSSMKKIVGRDPDGFWSEYKKKPDPRELPTRISARTKTDYTTLASVNVIGRWRGSDEALRDEHVVYSAHLDHVGVGEPVDGDSIYNGAHDNASGVACVLEIARTISRLKERPRRSMLFVMTTAEEMGLLGSEYFTRFPTVSNMVANINMDMPTLIAPLLSIEPLGAAHSDLMDNVRTAASRLKLDIMPDHMPEQVRFIRSDQYNFVRRGIPALHVKYGLKSADTLDLSARIKAFTKNVYHRPSDELDDSFDFTAGEVYVRLNFLIGYSVAQQDKRPSWNEGDFFGR